MGGLRDSDGNMIGRWAGVLQAALRRAGFEVHRARSPVRGIPDEELYHPQFEPWTARGWDAFFAPALERSIVSRDRLYVLYELLSQACRGVSGDAIECGVYRGGTARMFGELLLRTGSQKHIYLCDSFSGMPEVHPELDTHRRGDFADTSLSEVQTLLKSVANAVFVPGTIPESFAPIADACFCFAHVDVDLYDAVRTSTEFIYPRMNAGGFIVYDDYGFASCPGARRAVDEFYATLPEQPLVLATGQCVIFKAAP